MLNSQARKNEIEAWFRDHDDGDFSVLPVEQPSLIVGEFATAESVIYLTKHRCHGRIRGLVQSQDATVVLARYGLPLECDVQTIQKSSKPSIFIGDADPPDMLIFAWLRETIPIQWGGVSDPFLEQLGTRNLSWISFPMSRSEIDAIALVRQLVPNYRTLLGEYCSSLFDQGIKIELEGATISQRSQIKD